MTSPKIRRKFSWDTPASRKLIRAAALYAIASSHRDSIEKLGPELVAAQRAEREAKKALQKALDKLVTELRQNIDSVRAISNHTNAPPPT